jgi:hypothetical protein
MVNLLFDLDDLRKREENRIEVISNDITQTLLEWIIVSDEYEVYLKNPDIKHNGSVVFQNICNCESSYSIELLFKKNILEYIAVTLENLATEHDFKYLNFLYESISFLVKKNEFKKYFFENDKITIITVITDVVNLLWEKQIRTKLEDECIFRGVLIILKIYSVVVEKIPFPKDFIWVFKILKEIMIIFGKTSKNKGLKVEKEITPIMNGIDEVDMINLLFNLGNLCKREENITEVISNDIVQTLLEWVIIGNECEIYNKNRRIQHNACVIFQEICDSNESNIMILLNEKNLFECVNLCLEKLLNEHPLNFDICESVIMGVKLLFRYDIGKEKFLNQTSGGKSTAQYCLKLIEETCSVIENLKSTPENSEIFMCQFLVFNCCGVCVNNADETINFLKNTNVICVLVQVIRSHIKVMEELHEKYYDSLNEAILFLYNIAIECFNKRNKTILFVDEFDSCGMTEVAFSLFKLLYKNVGELLNPNTDDEKVEKRMLNNITLVMGVLFCGRAPDNNQYELMINYGQKSKDMDANFSVIWKCIL